MLPSASADPYAEAASAVSTFCCQLPAPLEGACKQSWLALQLHKEKSMEKDNRVLSRIGARELNQQEIEAVNGALKIRHTLTPCFIDKKQQLLNGDQAIGECGG
jgi:hypothetical protein